jgi:hypothetical protein
MNIINNFEQSSIFLSLLCPILKIIYFFFSCFPRFHNTVYFPNLCLPVNISSCFLASLGPYIWFTVQTKYILFINIFTVFVKDFPSSSICTYIIHQYFNVYVIVYWYDYLGHHNLPCYQPCFHRNQPHHNLRK